MKVFCVIGLLVAVVAAPAAAQTVTPTPEVEAQWRARYIPVFVSMLERGLLSPQELNACARLLSREDQLDPPERHKRGYRGNEPQVCNEGLAKLVQRLNAPSGLAGRN